MFPYGDRRIIEKSVDIRQAVEADAEAVAGLLEELSNHVGGPAGFNAGTAASVFREMNGLPGMYVNLAAEENGLVTGFCSLVLYKTPFHTGGTALISVLVVSSRHRGKGIGTALLNRAKRIAGERGMDEIEVGTEKANLGAQAFYRKNGLKLEYALFGEEL